MRKKISQQKMKYILLGSLLFVTGVVSGTFLLVKAHV
jgi:hypothetical protein